VTSPPSGLVPPPSAVPDLIPIESACLKTGKRVFLRSATNPELISVELFCR
jgi:hypothetical protein